ncbi:polysaccharide deacetylase family protein [Sphingomonas sp. HF-S3]|uniref:Chitooligosaccharide deacetylase n=1 Tax=Sphingomonas rustica TaxID=3103142 RepID=A0ABV0BBA5_9SPHN
MIRPLLGLAAALLAIAPQAVPAQPRGERPSVAITFDDLPMAGAGDVPLAEARAANRAIVRTLRRERVPAIGFVTEQNVTALGDAGRRLVRDWIAAGLELGNHGATHADINRLDIAAIRTEIEAGERTIRPLAERYRRPLRFYRFAYNHVGETEAKRVAIEAALAERGYRLAASTIDTSDYLFNRAYVRAATDPVSRARIIRAYLDHSRVQIRYYQGLSREVLGRAPPAILLLHVNEINAATLDELVALFRAEGFGFVSLAEAQADPAYATSPAVATKFGPMWGYRWARATGVRVDGSKEQEPPAWIATYGETGALPPSP